MGSPKGERHFEWANNNSQSVTPLRRAASGPATIPTIKCMMQSNNATTATSEIEILQRRLRLLHKEEPNANVAAALLESLARGRSMGFTSRLQTERHARLYPIPA